MWLIAKYKSNEINFLKNNLKKDFGDEIKFYLPKIKCEKYFKNKLKKFERFILGNYIFFHHKNFSDQKIEFKEIGKKPDFISLEAAIKIIKNKSN